MELDLLYPYGFRYALFDQLLSSLEHEKGVSIQSLQDSIATDLEDLLNSRQTKIDGIQGDFELAKHSILQFGLIDFTGLSITDPLDCEKICQYIEQAITAHEPRLRQIQVRICPDNVITGELYLNIHAILNVYPISEVIKFDALLQPTKQQYIIMAKS
ncbi:type VI secretion system baseplate subunit TssE [Acinetobacter rudis]|uniref:Type VI secretion system baseplate subunit TssE n=1 Tax=Acinetobacter rudis TaxID=632955 RepID=A0AAW8JDJ8_9GAMM|nr:type VI secretion system baseplate subunit TssE [Acinetobacter rudis]MDQ8936670.1 type VI secretion system baseplate subunit TssE [Acinetobacter rudis]MDQ9018914.1 type VI secretion system baseplate subunit TssE [Acinetobacter rudis]